MKIRDVLLADWDVKEITVVVREADTSKYIMQYRIGKNARAGHSERFLHQTECGDVYQSGSMDVLIMKRIIQNYQLPDLPPSKIGLRGILEKEIPVELMELEVGMMSPYGCGYSDGLHGYHFECYVNSWSGIDGENKQMSLEEMMKGKE